MPQASAEPRCREALGPVRFHRVAAVVAKLPANVDPDAVYRALDLGLSIHDLHRLLSPAWCRKRDDALENLRQAIVRLRATLEDVPRDTTYDVDDVNDLLGPLEREFRRLARPWDEADERGVGHPSLVMMSRWDVLSFRRTGRPLAEWRAEAERALRVAGVPPAKVAALLRASGLAEASPRRASRNPKK